VAGLKYVKGEPVDFAASKATLVFFWAKFAEGVSHLLFVA
jgi:hypothetical protein